MMDDISERNESDVAEEEEEETDEEEEEQIRGRKKVRTAAKKGTALVVVEDVLEEMLPTPLSLEDARAGLCQLGKTACGVEYAYLMMKVTNKGLTDIQIIPTFKHIMYVDVSGNRLEEEALTVLKDVEFLVMLNASENHMKTCKLPPLNYLQVLSLGKNKITSTEDIDQPILESLDLSYNSIKEITNLDPSNLQHLKILDVRGNSLTSTTGIVCPTLERLYLAENLIDKIEGIDALVNLQILHLRYNPLKDLSGFSEDLGSLTYINLRNTKVKRVKQVSKLAVLPKLDTLVVAETPLVKRAEDEYRVKILSYLSKLKRIDKNPVQDDELETADGIRKDREEAEEEEVEEESAEEEEEEDMSEM